MEDIGTWFKDFFEEGVGVLSHHNQRIFQGQAYLVFHRQAHRHGIHTQ